MATAAKSTAKSKTASRAAPRRTRRTGRRDPLAISLLKQDHREVEEWFDEYEQYADDTERYRRDDKEFCCPFLHLFHSKLPFAYLLIVLLNSTIV